MTTPQDKPSRELRKLVFRSFDGPLTRDEELELQAELLKSEAARSWYADAVSLHADLTTINKATEVCEQAFEQGNTEPPSAGDARESALNASRRVSPGFATRWMNSRLALFASVLFVGVGVGCSLGLFAAAALQPRAVFTANGWEWSVDKDMVAKTVGSSDAVLQTADVPETPPTRGLRIGQQVRLESGLIELTHRNGATVILEGPATYEARSDRGGKLFRGKAKVTVPEGLSAFILATRAGQFRCGAGEFGVEADSNENGGAVHMQAYPKGLSSEIAGSYVGRDDESYRFAYGESIKVGDTGGVLDNDLIQPTGPREFVSRMPERRSKPFLGDEIPLGNLFDDSKDASIDEAVATDTFQSAAEIVDLGVAAVHDGHLDADLLIAESGVRINLSNVGGGGPKVKGLPANDAYRSTSAVGIRTTGREFLENELGQRCEEGVGMSANEMLTFDLDEIRKAGQLEDRIMTFVSDRVGINDREPPATPHPLMASARFIVLVSSTDTILAGYIDGDLYPVHMTSDEVYTFDLSAHKLPRIIRRDGTFTSFDVPLPREARYLTLATCMHDVEHDDHSVFSGARLEIGGRFSEFAKAPSRPGSRDLWAPLVARSGLLPLFRD
ncbi:hypothetical protein MalM25_18640 [Planctomycetes bacterium MalM25]|nr:hypothetical protein MalM25_18640 [Planctomycetes bacterium MalM25]